MNEVPRAQEREAAGKGCPGEVISEPAVQLVRS